MLCEAPSAWQQHWLTALPASHSFQTFVVRCRRYHPGEDSAAALWPSILLHCGMQLTALHSAHSRPGVCCFDLCASLCYSNPQVLLFGILAVEIKRKAVSVRSHTPSSLNWRSPVMQQCPPHLSDLSGCTRLAMTLVVAVHSQPPCLPWLSAAQRPHHA